jgi:arginase family enzyme
MRTIDARPLGPFLRYTAPQSQLDRAFPIFRDGIADDRFILYGSGDFHYLAAWWIRALYDREPSMEAMTIVSFDNHPDWDVRPPRWACGGWINRALEMPCVAKASVWGCGNFEFGIPSRLFRNRRALKSGKLEVHGWAERQSPAIATRFNCMTRTNWRERFETFAGTLKGKNIYITVDLDGLASEYSLTNWENGLFTPEEIAWAIGRLRESGMVVGGDCCGAFSPPEYVRWFQRFAGKMDHPKLSERTLTNSRELNHQSLRVIWPALAGE